MLVIARQCRSMRAHAARRPNVFVLGAKPSLARGFAAASVRGTRSPYVGRFGGGVDASVAWASGINLALYWAVQAAALSWSTFCARSRALDTRGLIVVTRLLQIRRCPIGVPR